MSLKLRAYLIIAVLLLVAAGVTPWETWSLTASQAIESKPGERQSSGVDPQEAGQRQLDARDAALTSRELQLTATAADLSRRAMELDNSMKKLAVIQDEQKKQQSERAKKTLKIYRSLKPEEAAKLLDRLDEKTVTGIMNALDQKTVTQLIPFLNQQRVLAWTRETLAGK